VVKILLAIDAGNTNIKLGLFEGEELKFTFRLATVRTTTDDEYVLEFFAILGAHSIKTSDITGCIISSVVPEVTQPLKSAVKKILGLNAIVLGAGIKTGVNIKIDDTSTIGADFIAQCAAAQEYSAPCIIISLGTATTMLVLDENKTMIGGAIAPGISISLNALTSTSALLPSVAFELPKKTIGTNTADCLRSGVVLGNACMLDGMIEKFESALGKRCTLVATGGMASSIIGNCKRDIILREDLVLEGLRKIFAKNQKSSS
jgi:type III pantothenate kinase